MSALSPLENLTLIGHERECQQFLKMFHHRQCHHGWILSGAQGIGKATFAFHLARYVLSKRTDGNMIFSNQDPMIRRMIAGAHGDLFVVSLNKSEQEDKKDAQEITIDIIRQLNTFLNQTSMEGGWRVIIIDGAESLNRNAANALLKKLEEPPQQTLFFLITSYPSSLLPTIRSRCQMLSLKQLNEKEVEKVLMAYNYDISQELFNEWLKIAGGAPGKLLALKDLEDDNKLYTKLKMAILSIPNKSTVDTLSLIKLCVEPLKKWCLITELILTWIVQLVLAKAEEKNNFLDANWNQMKESYSLEELMHLWKTVQSLFQQQKVYQLDPKSILTQVFAAFEKRKL